MARLRAAPSALWLLALAVACGDNASDDLGGGDAGPNGSNGSNGGAGDVGERDGAAPCRASVVSAPEDVTAARGTTSIELVYTFDVAILDAEGAATVTGDGTARAEVADFDLRVVVEDLFNGASGQVVIDANQLQIYCGRPLADDLPRVAYAVEAAPWEHVGPIETGTVAAPAAPWFEEVTERAGLPETGPDSRAMLVDFDGDGFDDLVTLPVTALPLRPRFWRNRAGDGGFGFEDVTERSRMAEADATLIVFGDVDDDGDADAITLTGHRSPDGANGLWSNDGTGRFTYEGRRGIASSFLGDVGGGARAYHEPAAATLADFDADGDLDLYIGHWYAGILEQDGTLGNGIPTDDEVYRNIGSGTFQAVNLPEQLNPLTEPYLSAAQRQITGRAAYGLALGDYDDDGDPDLFVHNYGAGRPALGSPPFYWDHNLLWRNDPGLNFVDVGVDLGVDATLRGTTVQEETPVRIGNTTYPSPIGGNGFGCAFGDFDNDGDLDLISATIAHPDYPQSDRTLLWVNQGGGASFTEESLERGLEYAEDELHPVFVDIDQDGRVELAMSRLRETRMEFYYQTAEHTFDRQAYDVTGVDITRPGPTLWTDLDQDGDLDFFMPKGAGRVFENRAGDGRNWLQIRLEAGAPRDATGARVTMATSQGTLLREVVGGHGHYNSQPSRWLHFGLGADSAAAEVTVRWPDGEVQVLGAVRANQALTVVQGGEIIIE
jgi:hypothetical protein